MPWTRPSFEEIDMNAEIGGYQGDDGGDYEPIAEHRTDPSSDGVVQR